MSTPRNPVGWFEIYVTDMDRARAFYEKTFGQTLEHLPNPELSMWAFPGTCDGGGAAGALVKMDGKDPGPGGIIVYFSCEDCAEIATRAADAGGRIHLPKMAIGEYGFIALLYDSEGNMIGLHSMS